MLLVSTSQQKDREMGLKVTETYELNSRGMDIFLKSWVPMEKKAKGVIFLCHGYGDTVTFFFEGVSQSPALLNLRTGELVELVG